MRSPSVMDSPAGLLDGAKVSSVNVGRLAGGAGDSPDSSGVSSGTWCEGAGSASDVGIMGVGEGEGDTAVSCTVGDVGVITDSRADGSTDGDGAGVSGNESDSCIAGEDWHGATANVGEGAGVVGNAW